jgi:hypothetical protein
LKLEVEVKKRLSFFAPFHHPLRLNCQMLEMTKKSKAILSVICLLFCGFAGSDPGLGARQDQNVDFFSPSSLAVNLHATFNRTPLRDRKALARQVHTPGAHASALEAIYSSGLFLPSLELAPGLVICANDQSCMLGRSARAPPVP